MRNLFFYFLAISLLSACSARKDHAPSMSGPEKILLRDFRPVSIFNVPVTHIEKAMFPAIDMHAHPYPENADQLRQWVMTMDECGIQKSIVLTYSHGKTFDSLMAVYSAFPGRFELWCGLDFTGYDQPDFPGSAVRELERCYKLGARGVGELGDKGKGLFYDDPPAWGMHPDDPRMDDIFEKCAELGMPVNLHVADPKWMYEKMDSTNDGLMNAYTWKIDPEPGLVDHDGMIQILENTVKKHPETIFVACHLANCCYDLGKIGSILDNYPNLYIDIAARYAELAPIPRAAKEFFIRYQDRIVYGTDMGIQTDMYHITFRILETTDEHFYDHERFTYHWALNGLDLPEEVLKKVYQSNAEKILRDYQQP